jgi:hypothetical protein
MASIATRSAAKRPDTTPRSVRHTTGSPVTVSPADQTRVAAPGETVSLRANPMRMERSAPAGSSAAPRGISGPARSPRPPLGAG